MFSGTVISYRLKFNGTSSPARVKWRQSAPKKSACWLVIPGGDTAGQGSGPEARVAPVGHTGIKEHLFQTGSCREEGEPSCGRPACCFCQSGSERWWVEVAEEQEMTDSWAGSQAVRGLAHLCVCVCVYVCAWCVSRAHSRWQIGKATDGPGSISTAGCCDVSILPSLTTQPGRTRACPCDCLCVPVCFCCLLPSHGVCVCVCVVSKSEAQSLYLPSTIKVKVCLGGAVAERRRQLTL